MRILHIAHYDLYPRKNKSFIGNAKNGLERWLDSMITLSDEKYEHYVFFFNSYDNSISIQRILKDGTISEYTNFFNVEYDYQSLKFIFQKILSWFSPQLIHIHFLQEYTKRLPKLLHELGFDNTIATMHDESFLGENFGYNNEYKFDENIAEFFKYLQKVIFIHDISQKRYLEIYRDYIPTNKVVQISNGVSLPNVSVVNESTETFKVLFMGSFVEAKGSKIIQQFTQIVKANSLPIYSSLLGKIDLEVENISEFGSYNQKNIAEKVAMINPDVIIIPSIVEEVFPYTAVEATALGIPIICFNVGSLSNIESTNRGFIANERTVESLVEKVLEVFSMKKTDMQKWKDLLENIKAIKMFSELEMIAKYEEIYREVSLKTTSLVLYTEIFQQNLKNLKLKEQAYFDLTMHYNNLGKLYTAEMEKNNKQTNLSKGKNILRKFTNYIRNHGGFFSSIRYFFSMIKLYGVGSVVDRIIHGKRDIEYSEWIQQNEHIYLKDEVEEILEGLSYQPKISFLVPVYNVDEVYLRACIDSIIGQSYTNWELCIADDASTKSHVKEILNEYIQKDNRIKVVFRTENGHISAATNSALEIATGEFVAFMDNDDMIVQDALLEVIKVLNQYPDIDMVYSDEDKIDASGDIRLASFFKPDWSPDAFWGHMYACHFNVYRKSIAQEIGGLRIGFEGAQDYDFVFRFTEKTDKIYHIPKILYHWRMIETSTASATGNKDYAYMAAIKAKKEAISRRGFDAYIEDTDDHRSSNVVFNPRKTDFVSIIIPTKNHADDVEKCLDSIYDKSTWKNFEVILVDNNSDEAYSLEKFEAFKNKYDNFTVLRLEIPFNYSKLNNEGAKIAKGNLLLFLNNDTEVITEDWLERLIGQAILPYVGSVGAKLLYEDKTIQHAGVIIRGEEPVHAFLGFKEDDLGYFGRLDLNYNYLAVTGACLMVKKEIFEQVGGFDEELPVAYNDVEFCIRVFDAGFYNVVRSDVKLYHFESKTRGYDNESQDKMERLERERKVLTSKWGKYIKEDPFYNKNLTTTGIHFSLRK